MKNALIKAKEEVVVDAELEKSSTVRKILNFIFTRILLYLPFNWGTKFFMKSCKGAAEMRRMATTWKALEIIYNWDPVKNDWISEFELADDLKNNFFTQLWERLDNVRAVRNRLKLVKRELRKAIIELSRKENKKEIVQVGLGCGSSRANLEILAEIRQDLPEINVKTILIDYSRSALDFSRNLAVKLGLDLDSIIFKRGNILEVERYINEVDIIEANGILPYLGEVEAMTFLEKIYNRLNRGGILIVSNTGKNFETRFVRKIVGYDSMRVRDVELVVDLVREAGFEVKVVHEPFNLHSLVVGKKILLNP